MHEMISHRCEPPARSSSLLVALIPSMRTIHLSCVGAFTRYHPEGGAAP
jgi:hypothetical protein